MTFEVVQIAEISSLLSEVWSFYNRLVWYDATFCPAPWMLNFKDFYEINHKELGLQTWDLNYQNLFKNLGLLVTNYYSLSCLYYVHFIQCTPCTPAWYNIMEFKLYHGLAMVYITSYTMAWGHYSVYSMYSLQAYHWKSWWSFAQAHTFSRKMTPSYFSHSTTVTYDTYSTRC